MDTHTHTHTIWTLLPDLWTLNGHSVRPYPTEHQGTTDKSSPRLLLLGSQWLLPGTHTHKTHIKKHKQARVSNRGLTPRPESSPSFIAFPFLCFLFGIQATPLLTVVESQSTLYRHQTVHTESFLQTRASSDVMFVESELKTKNLWWIFALLKNTCVFVGSGHFKNLFEAKHTRYP